jgi:hypothetical protein
MTRKIKKTSTLFLALFCIAFLNLSCSMIKDAINNGGYSSNRQSQKSTKLNPLTLPIGIDIKDVPLAGSVGSAVYNKGIQEGVRKGGDRDATRFLEDAVKNNDIERVRKLLASGASAYVSYDMIDNKQYEIMQLMHENNPLLIRFSQMIHYACANSDSQMVDFLVDHNASLDLCGNYWEKQYDANYGSTAFKRCNWNSDGNLYYTPLDCALRKGNVSLINYVIDKYGKRPTTTGVADYLYDLISADDVKNENVKSVIKMLPSLDQMLGGNALTQVFNKGVCWVRDGKYGYNYLLILALDKLGGYKDMGKNSKVEQFEQLFQIMMDNNADVKVFNDKCSILDIGIGSNITWFENAMSTSMKHSGMLDIIRILKAKGAPMTIKATQQGRVGNVPLEKIGIKDEYKEKILTGEL